MHGKILIRRVKGFANDKNSEEQGGFRTGKYCVDQNFNMRMTTEKMLAKDKVYDIVDWEAMWDVLEVYELGRRLLNGVKSFYRDASPCVKEEIA